MVTTLAPRRRAAMMCRAVFGWLAMFAPQRTIILEFSAMSSLVLTLSAPVRPTPKPPSPQQIIAGCQFWPILATIHIGEAVHHLNRDCASGRKAAMTRPKADGLGPDCPHALHDEIQRLIPAHAAPVIREAIITNLGVQ